MSKASALLKSAPTTTQPKATAKVTLFPPSTTLSVPTYSRPASAAAVARLYRIKARALKSMETEVEAIKGALRTAGEDWLSTNASEGRYYTVAEVGAVTVTRANRFAAAPWGRDDIKDAVGEAYGIMFKEGARLEFSSIDDMRRHVTMCQEAGVPVTGQAVESVTPTPAIVQHLCQLRNTLDGDRVALLEACAKDQAARVAVKKGGR